MFGRFNEIDDKPDWREKLAELRDSPPWVPHRPEWLVESPAALLLLFVGIALIVVSLVYLVVPADALPGSIPGRWSPPPTTASTTTSSTTTTTTVPASKKAVALQKIATLPKAEKDRAWDYIRAVGDYRRKQAEVDRIIALPVEPPSRRWAFAFIAAVLAAGTLWAAWLLSETRSRIQFHT